MEELTRINLGCGDHHIANFENLDLNNGFDALRDWDEFEDESVWGITISHVLMYIDEDRWGSVFHQMYRVLMPGGTVRITEDSTDNPLSERFGGNPGDPELKTLTTIGKVTCALMGAGFVPYVRNATSSRDPMLRIDIHGGEPKVFFMEGIKPGAPWYAS